PPLDVSSSSHPNSDIYYNDDFDQIAFSWEKPFPGLQGYYLALNDEENYVPSADNAEFLADEVTTYDRDDLVDGANYFHITPVDSQSNTGGMESRFPVYLNTEPPTVTSDSHSDEAEWSDNDDVNLSWSDERPEDSFTGYYYTVDEYGDTVPDKDDTFLPIDQKQTILSDHEEGAFAFHIVPVDTVGNLTSEAETYRFRIGDDPGEGTVLGTARDEDGNDIEDVRVTVNRGLFGDAVPDDETNASGEYNLGDVPVGEWEFQATADGYETEVITDEVVDGESLDVDFTMTEE
ncbi:MAG: carboxypeptidase-like regulatory domain-containing protein, partial [Persicimonas sp.]